MKIALAQTNPTIGDIDGNRHRVHVRAAKGGKDRYVPLPDLALRSLRRFWATHRHDRLLFPNPTGGARRVRHGIGEDQYRPSR